MVEVRLRHADEAFGARLGEVDLLKVDQVIPMLRMWGVGDFKVSELHGSFDYDVTRREAFFEVVVGDTL